MNLTPRQIIAYFEFNEKLDRIERANNLWLTAMGAQGDGEEIKKHLKELGAL